MLAAALPALLLTTPSSSLAEEVLSGQALPLSGNPRLVAPNGPAKPLDKNRALRPGERIETGPEDRAVIWFSAKPGCRFILETNSHLEILRSESPRVYTADLRRGAMRCEEASCGVTVDVRTPVARLLGNAAQFWVEATDGATTVYLKSGDLRLLVRGQVIPLRAMTQTIISRSGSHRISSIVEEEFRNAIASPSSPPADPSRKGFSDGRVSPASAAGRP